MMQGRFNQWLLISFKKKRLFKTLSYKNLRKKRFLKTFKKF